MNRPYTGSRTETETNTPSTCRTGERSPARLREGAAAARSSWAIRIPRSLVRDLPEAKGVRGGQPEKSLQDAAGDRRRRGGPVAALLHHHDHDVLGMVGGGHGGEPRIRLLAGHVGRPRLAGHRKPGPGEADAG